ncbi:MAG: TlyA family RNA methyltransferase [Clostridiaceae bacterium]|nr:TlyA family RNA methyltransferase [Clostridiaceae bacterium]
MSKERLDVILVSKGLFESREKARGAIMAGLVFINGERCDKPGAKFEEECEIEIKGKVNPYVSRGGLKLEKAINEFNLNLKDFVCVDVGASTGGFTDVMLKNGAKKVYAVDVGYGQLAWELRNDPRVVCMERTNFRYVTREQISEPLDFGAADVSFISLKLILPPLKELLKQDGRAVCLIKPQFEAGREKVGKKGVVRDPAVHEEVINNVINVAENLGFSVGGLSFSPITGPEGNIEYLIYLLNGDSEIKTEINAAKVVKEAHEALG